jgi:recombination protein RecA
VVKNKVSPPFRKAEFDLMYGEGISKTGEIVDLGVDYNIIKKSGSWYSYGDVKLGQGRDFVKTVIRDNIELAAELGIKITEAMKAPPPPKESAKSSKEDKDKDKETKK